MMVVGAGVGATMVLFGLPFLLEGLLKAIMTAFGSDHGYQIGRTLGGAALVGIGGALLCWCLSA